MRVAVSVLLGLCLSVVFAGNVSAVCKGRFPDPVREIAWVNLFPIRVGGVKVFDADIPDTARNVPAICICKSEGGFVVGITVSFWEPAGFLEAVFDPGCVPTLGFDIDLNSFGMERHHGGYTNLNGKNYEPTYTAQVHWIKAPLLSVFRLLVDVDCLEDYTGIDVAYLSEPDPLWQDDMMSAFLTPEAFLFANPALLFACMADATKAAFSLPIDRTFWCMGGWGTVYPLTKNLSQDNIPVGAAAIVSRELYRMHREGTVKDRAEDPCGDVFLPVWRKSHYRLQPVRPKAMTNGSIRIGQPAFTWTYKIMKPSMKGHGNWSFVLWRKVVCCMGINPLDRL